MRRSAASSARSCGRAAPLLYERGSTPTTWTRRPRISSAASSSRRRRAGSISSSRDGDAERIACVAEVVVAEHCNRTGIRSTSSRSSLSAWVRAGRPRSTRPPASARRPSRPRARPRGRPARVRRGSRRDARRGCRPAGGSCSIVTSNRRRRTHAALECPRLRLPRLPPRRSQLRARARSNLRERGRSVCPGCGRARTVPLQRNRRCRGRKLAPVLRPGSCRERVASTRCAA